ncbi:MAG: endonuclease MutS2 [Chloroflexi bacterium]|nr:endonuclease MutS2 [Chloroflexota bacterium]
MDHHTLAVLEFPAVLSRLAALTSFSAGREAALALRPVVDHDLVVRRQRQTGEAIHLRRMGIEASMGGARDIRASAGGAARGQALTAGDLLDVASLCRAATQAARTLTRNAEDAPLLASLGGGFADLDPLRDLIEGAIDEGGSVRDSASTELAQIRRELHEAHARLQQRLQAMLSSSSVAGALQEPIIVMRDGRYVLPVKADFRGAVRGVVHDTSASGQTVYVEPLAVVDLANRWRELQVQERHEVERILSDLSLAVGSLADDLIDAVQRLGEVDLAQAKARLGDELGATALSQRTRASWIVEAPAELRLVEARHPLLSGHVVPVSLHVGGETRALLITGPNTGGKTVALKTAGLLCLMALAGLPVPAEAGTHIPVYHSIFADIGDEQSIAQSLSTFSGHMTAVIGIIERADTRSLVLLDEVGAGTDPTEGAALGIAIVERLVESGAALIATTHHSELKLYAHQTPGVQNASVEFDLESLRPTYRLTVGLPGQSNALAIASNLGMPADVIARARAGLSSDERDLESLLAELRAQLSEAETRAEAAARAAAEAEAIRDDLYRRQSELTADEARLRQDARARIRRELHAVERMLEKSRREVEAARIEQARIDLARARVQIEELPAEPEADSGATVDASDIGPGTRIWLRGMDTAGEALDEPDEDGELEVQLGALRTRVRIEQVARIDAPQRVWIDRSRVAVVQAPDSGEEVDLRGRTIDEALPLLDEFLDHAARAGRARVRLIHGKGTGALRRAVREFASSHPLVKSYESAEAPEGGEGVTIALLEQIWSPHGVTQCTGGASKPPVD